ncbi:ABC transporter permease [Oleidesulfovibrio sp.]|uniref:ABC transporter permease n=1 Tax=Oleidesulfovibrio sp. TaxID=2909707 RepID=UPI003A89D01F
MNIFTIPWRYSRKKWPRTLLLLAVFTLGVVSIVALQQVSRVVGDNLERKLTSFGANILITPKQETLSITYGGFSMGNMLMEKEYINLDSALASIDGIALRPNISLTAPKLVAMAHVDAAAITRPADTSSKESAEGAATAAQQIAQMQAQEHEGHKGNHAGMQSVPAMHSIPQTTTPPPVSGMLNIGVIGVNWAQETALKSYWVLATGEWAMLPAAPPDAMGSGQAMAAQPKAPVQTGKVQSDNTQSGKVLAGSALAAKLHLVPGSRIPLGNEHVTVSGILRETGTDDDNVLLADITTLQNAFGLQGKASFMEIAALCAGCPIEDIVHQLATALPETEVKALRNIVEQRMFSVHFVQRLILTVSVVILLTACAMVAVSMLSAVNERKKEIGILRSVGFSRGRVFAIFCAEATGIGLVAGLIGYMAGHILSLEIVRLLEMADGALPAFSPVAMLITCLMIVCVSVVSALFPAWKASRIEPASVLVAL